MPSINGCLHLSMDSAVHLLHINDNQSNTYTYIHTSNTKLYLSIVFLNLLRFQSTVSLNESTPSFLHHFNKFFLQYFFSLKDMSSSWFFFWWNFLTNTKSFYLIFKIYKDDFFITNSLTKVDDIIKVLIPLYLVR
jgi:hypothetical protein